MTTPLDALIEVAESRGYGIRWHKGGPKAAWQPRRKIVTIRLGMSDATTLCALAHELGHAHYGDPPGHHGAHEYRADRFAARLLISPTEYAAAEALYGPQLSLIAHELGVTVKVLKTWITLYERTAA
ncbi:ImmA/IrrE family metallo-endopeptidase [Corynebacterium accolens]|uniref:ImmA/IrrE family metallo-endopeptidase n=1 Tax=Corynebacterium accolens TaxID=38284 RepID=UPI0025519255|nr:ImmA/IrrE family metallo-endopeptidase [Corynebacterium accolens]MDK8472364.1 ImmA/IrrE family metallo-endopeptidase [Corynebacterium accolens]MDK8618439.1 ImmA/IrrE family metallo-endopeptidase [Corynebacterium accolens]